MIYVVDNGYGGKNENIKGDKVDRPTHGTSMCDVIATINKKAIIQSVHVPRQDNEGAIFIKLLELSRKVKKQDIIVFGFLTQRNELVDQIVEDLSLKCTIIVPSGNHSKHTKYFSPYHNNIIVVQAIDQHDKVYVTSNWGEGKQVTMYGWCPTITRHLNSSSLATALYAGIYSRNKTNKFLRRARKVLKNYAE